MLKSHQSNLCFNLQIFIYSKLQLICPIDESRLQIISSNFANK